jgi:hypothetical protein
MVSDGDSLSLIITVTCNYCKVKFYAVMVQKVVLAGNRLIAAAVDLISLVIL